MKHARELIECGVHSIDIQDQVLWVGSRNKNSRSRSRSNSALYYSPVTISICTLFVENNFIDSLFLYLSYKLLFLNLFIFIILFCFSFLVFMV